MTHALQWEQVERAFKKLQRLEKKEQLLPLSSLFLVASHVLRIQNNEYSDQREQEKLYEESLKQAEKGIEQLRAYSETADSATLAMKHFIEGGINGFTATLKIETSPFEALNEGLSALKLLEQAIEVDTTLYDAYLGCGIFHCSLAKSPAIVKGALKVLGRSASVDSGLAYLRLSAHNGRYTSSVAKIYLIHFLSPYYGHLRQEKTSLMHALQSQYSRNPYFFFLEFEELLCFYPPDFYALDTRRKLKNALHRCEDANQISCSRYCELLKWQYWLLNPFPPAMLRPDAKYDLQAFNYYPLFVRTVSDKHFLTSCADNNNKPEDFQQRRTSIEAHSEMLQKMVEESTINTNRQGFYRWHVRDALRFED
ncbi:MAG: hypothetical protein GF398_05515 [Chitinivibrionales bacterium]|nr:hypothetical protein [Chitinivibrionales bacterium]